MRSSLRRLRSVLKNRKYNCFDAHACGEPARVVLDPIIVTNGASMRDQRLRLMQEHDDIRKLLLHEPRGYPAQNVNFIFESQLDGVAAGFVIAEQGGIYPYMSGHNAMCVARVLIETGAVSEGRFALEAPSGIVWFEARRKVPDGPISIRLETPPVYVYELDAKIQVPSLGHVALDLAWGGMRYAVVEANKVGLAPLDPLRGRDIVRIGEMIKTAAMQQRGPTGAPEILVFTEPPIYDYASDTLRARNTVVMSNTPPEAKHWERPESFTGMLDRSPCGTGTCAVMACLHARQILKIGQSFVHESIIGSSFQAKLMRVADPEEVTSSKPNDEYECPPFALSAFPPLVPSIQGQAWITAHATIICEPSDPFPNGIPLVNDIW